jgi:hypothetical protein
MECSECKILKKKIQMLTMELDTKVYVRDLTIEQYEKEIEICKRFNH